MYSINNNIINLLHCNWLDNEHNSLHFSLVDKYLESLVYQLPNRIAQCTSFQRLHIQWDKNLHGGRNQVWHIPWNQFHLKMEFWVEKNLPKIRLSSKIDLPVHIVSPWKEIKQIRKKINKNNQKVENYLATIDRTVGITVAIFHRYTSISANLLASFVVPLSTAHHFCSVITIDWTKISRTTEIRLRTTIGIHTTCKITLHLPSNLSETHKC